MDGESLKLLLNSQHDKSGGRIDDRISQLPQEILVFILSFLSVKEAAATSLLSPRWYNLWKHTHTLTFTSKILNLNQSYAVQDRSWDAERCEYVKLVNSVLASHRPRFLELFKICFYVNRSAQSQVENWLDSLLSTRVERLELDLRCWNDRNNKVVLWDYLSKKQEGISQIILFKSLKTLSLKAFQLSGEDMKILLDNCPCLMVLKINAATFTSDVEICGKNLVLKELEIHVCLGRKCIKVSAPNLTRIRIDDTSGKLMFDDVGKVYRAAFEVRLPENFAQHFGSQVSCFISQLRRLALAVHHAKEFLWKEFPQMPNLMKLTVVEGFEEYEQGYFMHFTSLIWASPRLQEFHLKFLGEYEEGSATLMEAQAITNVKRPRHQNLKTFKFRGSCRGVGDRIIELATYITKNCSALQKIIIGSTLKVSSDMKAEAQARDSIKLQLQPKLRKLRHRRLRRIQLKISEPVHV